ncbi:hypothetical protein LCGC14_1629000 [marine sediment metagenome]|uniref:Uncharacterized protein n=1 Tax=marine sediment metagenome TaxID=412755 RepID=A0A0F9IQB1_9ZZZZ
MSRLEASEIYLVLSVAKTKLQGKEQTLAKKHWENLGKILLKEFKKVKEE